MEARTVPHHRFVHLRWDASPWLLVPVPFLAAPAAALWIGAALQMVGVGRSLDAMLAFFAFFGGEVAVDDWTVDLRLRLPRPPWSAVDVIGALFLIFTALLTLAVAAHAVTG
jgi:hypothetical protein